MSFFARRAEGPGYAGRARYYSLETQTNLNAVEWQPVANFTNILGDNRTVVYVAAAKPAPRFCRGKVRLSGL